MAKKKLSAKMVNELSAKSGFSPAFIYTVLSFGFIGAYDFFNNVKIK